MRYFIEVSYKGTNYSGFQTQHNANTIQAEVEKALSTLFPSLKTPPLREELGRSLLTGSSRTDAGVHALQNYFHFDSDTEIPPTALYNLNALLPRDIAVRSLTEVPEDAHCRFDALSREYTYYITRKKDPFRFDTAWFYPFKVDVDILQQAAAMLLHHNDFTSFSKRNSQVKTKDCTIMHSEWKSDGNGLEYHVKANRFLRGMVRGLVATMLLAGRKKITLEGFEKIILAKDCTRANFASPAHGLFLVKVEYAGYNKL